MTFQSATNSDGYPIWWAVDGPHAGSIHDNPTCNCGGTIVALYYPAPSVGTEPVHNLTSGHTGRTGEQS